MTDEREIVADALVELVKAIRWTEGSEERSFKLVGRRMKTFDQVPSDQKPCAFVVETNETLIKETRKPRRLIQPFSLVVYHAVGANPDAVPAITNNRIMAAIEDGLDPKPTDPGFRDARNTLGGLVHKLWIEGEVIKDPGDLDKQGLIVVPIKVMHP